MEFFHNLFSYFSLAEGRRISQSPVISFYFNSQDINIFISLPSILILSLFMSHNWCVLNFQSPTWFLALNIFFNHQKHKLCERAKWSGGQAWSQLRGDNHQDGTRLYNWRTVLMGKGVPWLWVRRVRLKSEQWGWDRVKQKGSGSKQGWKEKGQCPEEQSGEEQDTSFRKAARKQAEKSLTGDKWTRPHDSTIWNDKRFQGRAICLLSRL